MISRFEVGKGINEYLERKEPIHFVDQVFGGPRTPLPCLPKVLAKLLRFAQGAAVMGGCGWFGRHYRVFALQLAL